MPKKQFVIADTHFGHKGIITFTNKTGCRIRPFDTIEKHDDFIVYQWNSVVGTEDTVYVLGDLAMNRKSIATIDRCNGRKILIKGNHDIFKLKDYTPYFEDIRAYKIFPKEGIILSHIPIHPDCMDRWKVNVHGHLHANNVIDPDDCFGGRRYKCVSCEQINYKPVVIEEIKS